MDLTSQEGHMEPSQVDWPKEVVQPLNLFHNMKPRGRINIDDSILILGAYLESSGTEHSYDPLHALVVLTDSFVIERCCHDRDAKLDHADPLWDYSSPGLPRSTADGGKKSIVVVDGSD
ncbi:unnamed protein product [Fusarium venenatum]|uniref:Uncharacterized protein n=1 Tax=Fusarium venenatum TaxID=56646 RepID=A0A2L2THP4_9HYPO|nr:uncharacterized protein FVRRES_04055 [Fusarium venenatum]KAH7002980.1 hypothetical protein EDB82DRAFT_549449 [Fusarium venenatum]CEI67543.1 unnamed protein product [Fusarium venenatum]